MFLELLTILAPALALVVWFRSQTKPTLSWWLIVAVLAATILFFYFPHLLVRFWVFPFSSWLVHNGITVDDYPHLYRFIDAFMLAAIPEEAFKFLVLALICLVPGALRSTQQGTAWGSLVGIGHAVGENLQDFPDGWYSQLLHGGMKLIGTTALSAIMGYWLGIGIVEVRRKYVFYILAIFVPVVLHGLYDFGTFIVELAQELDISEDQIPPWPMVVGIIALPFTQLAILIGGGWAIYKAYCGRCELGETQAP